jgi:hypothetical protein
MTRLTLPLLAASWRSWLANDFVRAGPYWLQLLWTAVFAGVLAVFFTVFGFFVYTSGQGGWGTPAGWAYWYGQNLIVCLVVAYVIHAFFEFGAWRLGPERLRSLAGWRRSAFFAGIPMLGLVIGWPIGIALTDIDLMSWLQRRTGIKTIAFSLLFSLAVGWVLHHWFESKARQILAERRAAEAQLRLLQGQIEPHFLFNTLATVASLIDHEPARAKGTLLAFTDYLRASLVGLRRERGTVADELALAEAYLRVQQNRMEDRLRFEIDADEAARGAELPPMVLQPLVENAVHHGLEPQIDGGTVRVSARAEGRRLVIDVRDDGRGLGNSTRKGTGIALANVRERLAHHFGIEAEVQLTAAQPGTLARLVLPLRTA